MKTETSAIITSTLLAGLLAAPSPAPAAGAEQSYVLQTRIVERFPSIEEVAGSLLLRITPDGVVSGYYRPQYSQRFVPVSGGVSGDRFWIDLGSFAAQPLRFSGTFCDGKIDAQSSSPVLDNGIFTALELIAQPKSP